MAALKVLQPTRKLGHYRYIRFGISEATAARIDKLKAAAERFSCELDIEASLRARLATLLDEAEADLAELAQPEPTDHAQAAASMVLLSLSDEPEEPADARPCAEG